MIYNEAPEFKGPLKTKWLDLNSAPGSVLHTTGRIYYSTADKTFVAYNDDSTQSLLLGEQIRIRVYNNTGFSIPAGRLVSSNGVDGSFIPVIVKTDITNPAHVPTILGVTTVDIPDGSYSYVLTNGVVKGIDTSAYADGTSVWASVTEAGLFQATKPDNDVFLVGTILEGGLTGSMLLSPGKIEYDTLQTITTRGNVTTNGITVNDLTAKYIDLAPTAAPAWQQGLLFTDSSTGALSYYNSESDITLQIGEETYIQVRNNTGVTIPNGSAVYVTGAVGLTPTIALSQANGTVSSRCIGVATHSIENNTEGYITTLGTVNDLNTSAFTAGDELYLSSTIAGAFQNTRPTGTDEVVIIGVCLVSNPSNGSIKVQLRPDSEAAIKDLAQTISAPWTFSEGLETTDILFDTTYVPTGSEPEGSLFWNETDQTLDLVRNGTTLQLGQELYIRTRNVTGVTIPNGKVVYSSGHTGIFPDISLAQGNTELTGRTIGITTEDIANNAFGAITTFGYVRGLKTDYVGAGAWGTTWVENDTLYLSADVPGGITNVEPPAPHHSDEVGVVGVVHPTQGTILVGIQKHTRLDQLSDVNGTVTDTNGQLVVWDNDLQLFDFTANINDYQLSTGDGSGLTNVNATTLDSLDSIQFLRSDVIDYKTAGNLVLYDNVVLQVGTDNADRGRFWNSGTYTYLDLYGATAPNFYIRDGANTRFSFLGTSGNFTATGKGKFGTGADYALELESSTGARGIKILSSDGATRGGLDWNTTKLFFRDSTDTERLTLEYGGYMGLGTGSPISQFHVQQGAIGTTWGNIAGNVATFESSTSNRCFVSIIATNQAELWFGDADSPVQGRVRYDNTDNSMEFWTAASQKMSLSSTGTLTLESTSPNFYIVDSNAATDEKTYFISNSTGKLGIFLKNDSGSTTQEVFSIDRTGISSWTADFTSDVTAFSLTLNSDNAYGASWNGSLAVPTENAVYDKIETLTGGSSSYDVYTANVSQSLALAPEDVEMENTLGTITWARTSSGTYTCTSAGLFTANKTVVFTTPFADAGNSDVTIKAHRISDNVISVVRTVSGTSSDNGSWAFEIRVYPSPPL